MCPCMYLIGQCSTLPDDVALHSFIEMNEGAAFFLTVLLSFWTRPYVYSTFSVSHQNT